MIYLITFLLAFLASIMLQNALDNGKKKKVIFWSTAIILILSVLAGLRDVSVGTDNFAYRRDFLAFSSYTSFRQITTTGSLEILFDLLFFIISRFTQDYHVVCFATEFLTMFFVLKGLIYFRNNGCLTSIPLGILVWLFCQYCNFYNIVQQGMAVAIIFYALKYLLEDKKIVYLLFVCFAMLFHISAILGVGPLLIYMIVKSKFSTIKLFLWIGILIISMAGISYVGNFVIRLGLLSESYAIFLNRSFEFSFKQVLYRLPVLLLSSFHYKYIEPKVKEYKFWVAMLWVEAILSQLAMLYGPAYRVSLYCWVSNMIIIPSFTVAYKKDNRLIIVAGIIVYLILYWSYFYIYNAYNFLYPVYPFVSDILQSI